MNKNKKHIINWELLTNILDKSANADERELFNSWIAKPDNKIYYEDVKNIWEKTGDISHCYANETNNAWQIVSNKTINNSNKHLGIKKLSLRVAQIAAVIALLFVLGKVYLNPVEQVLKSNNIVIADYVLPDSSLVTLNANSTLTFTNKFRGIKRQVNLDGEAFFKVKRNPHKPFVIKTKQGAVEVLGTSFNLKAIDTGKLLELNVKTGKVKFTTSKTNEFTIVKKGEAMVYNSEENKINQYLIKNNNYLAWKTKVIEFDNVPLSQVVKTLESVYKTKINIKDNELNNIRFSGSFDNQTLEKILKVIALTFDIGVSHVNETIELNKIFE